MQVSGLRTTIVNVDSKGLAGAGLGKEMAAAVQHLSSNDTIKTGSSADVNSAISSLMPSAQAMESDAVHNAANISPSTGAGSRNEPDRGI